MWECSIMMFGWKHRITIWMSCNNWICLRFLYKVKTLYFFMPKEFQELLVIHQSLILHVLVGLSFGHLVQFRYFQQKNTFLFRNDPHSQWSMIAQRIDFCSSAFDPTAATIADKQILFRQPSLWKYNWRRNRNTQIYKSKYNWRRNANTQIQI